LITPSPWRDPNPEKTAAARCRGDEGEGCKKGMIMIVEIEVTKRSRVG
jgi:hypothetical protein